MGRLRFSTLLLGAALAACDDGSSDSTAGTAINGGVVYHSVNKLVMTTAPYTELEVALVDEGKLLADADAAPIASAPLDGASTTGKSPFAFSTLELTGASVGVVTRVRDTRATPLWLTTEASSVDAAALAELQSKGGTFDDAVGFALSRDALDGSLAALAGVSSADILARGMVFGLVYDGQEADGSGAPVAGATVAASLATGSVAYPTAKFDATQAATGGQGAFLFVPSDASATPRGVTFTVTPPAGSTLSWDATLQAVVRPGAVFFLRLYAK
jgi:hypothetical protein